MLKRTSFLLIVRLVKIVIQFYILMCLSNIFIYFIKNKVFVWSIKSLINTKWSTKFYFLSSFYIGSNIYKYKLFSIFVHFEIIVSFFSSNSNSHLLILLKFVLVFFFN